MNLSDAKDRVKEHADLGAIIAKYTKPVKTATGFKACCPLPGHKEKTPSFHYNQRGNYFFCYGCNRGGDVFKFLELVEGLPFFEALKELAETLGIELPKFERSSSKSNSPSSGTIEIPGQEKQKSVREKGFEFLAKAKVFFTRILVETLSPGARRGLDYLDERGITRQELELYGIGWSLENGDPLCKKITSENDFELAKQVGLVRQFDGRKYDFFRGRLMIPILDARGRTIGFSGRTLDEVTGKNPKYINSSESEWFKKKAVLYGLERAQKHIRSDNYVCVVEGFFDQWAFDRHEIPAVAVMGTALTPEHLAALGRYTKNVVLVMDTDDAGIQSTKKSISLLVESGWSARVFSDFKGKDPDEWLKNLSDKKNIKQNVRTQLLAATEGLEWLADRTVVESQKRNLSRGEIIQELAFVWSLAKTENQKLRIMDMLSPIVGFSAADLRKALDELRPPLQTSNQKSAQTMEKMETQGPVFTHNTTNQKSNPNNLAHSIIDKLAEQTYLWWVWHKDFLWPKDQTSWDQRKALFEGTLLEPVVLKLSENSDFWGLEGPSKVAEIFFDNTKIDPFLNAVLLKSMVRSDKGQADSSDKAWNSFVEMAKLLESEKTKNKIAYLKNEIRKNSHDPEKTAQLLQAVQELIQTKN
jgi:DNA primase catalytic core